MTAFPRAQAALLYLVCPRNFHDSFILVHLVSVKDNGVIFFPRQRSDDAFTSAMSLHTIGKGLKMVKRDTSE